MIAQSRINIASRSSKRSFRSLFYSITFKLLIIVFVLLFISLVFSKQVSAQALTVSPPSVDCTSNYTLFSGSGMDPGTVYTVRIICETCPPGHGYIDLFQVTGANGFSKRVDFDVNGNCGSGQNITEGRYGTYLVFDPLVVAGPDLYLSDDGSGGGGGGGGGGADISFSDLINITAPKFTDAKIGDIITALLPYVFRIAGFLLLFLLVLGGYEILTSQGDPKKVASGNQKLFYAVIGFILIIASFLLVRTIGRILGIQQIKEIFG